MPMITLPSSFKSILKFSVDFGESDFAMALRLSYLGRKETFFVFFLTLTVLYSSSVDTWDVGGMDGAALCMWQRERSSKRRRKGGGRGKWRTSTEWPYVIKKKVRMQRTWTECPALGWRWNAARKPSGSPSPIPGLAGLPFTHFHLLKSYFGA